MSKMPALLAVPRISGYAKRPVPTNATIIPPRSGGNCAGVERLRQGATAGQVRRQRAALHQLHPFCFPREFALQRGRI